MAKKRMLEIVADVDPLVVQLRRRLRLSREENARLTAEVRRLRETGDLPDPCPFRVFEQPDRGGGMRCCYARGHDGPHRKGSL